MTKPLPKIPGTTPFDGEQARKGYALNKMCFSFNSAENRAAFKQDEEAYMRQYGLNQQQADAIRARNVLEHRRALGRHDRIRVAIQSHRHAPILAQPSRGRPVASVP